MKYSISCLNNFLAIVLVAFVAKASAKENNVSLYGNEISFIENKGQIINTDSKLENRALYYIESRNVSCFLKKSGISYVWQSVKPKVFSAKSKYISYQMDIAFLNFNPSVKIYSEEPTSNVNNYYLPHCPEGILNVNSYNKVIYENIYDKIDLVLYIAGGDDTQQLIPIKYDFIVKPGGDPKQIQIKYIGSKNLKVANDGSLTAYCPLGELKEGKPFTYQNIGRNHKFEITSAYKVNKHNIVSFNISTYDVDKDLIIDPSIQWSTYYGGAGVEISACVDSDGSGNSYLCGQSTSTGLATAGAHQTTNSGTNVIIVKFNSSGVRQWATYYGGNNTDVMNIRLDAAGSNIYIVGKTSSTTAVASGGHQNTYGGGTNDAFLAKFNSSGVRQWATYYGGSGSDDGYGVAVDASGNIYLSGWTNSTSSIASVGSFQTSIVQAASFLAKFNSSGVRQWATYYGDYNSVSASVGTDSQNNVFITGIGINLSNVTTSGVYQSSCAGSVDVFLAKFNSSGSRLWSTFYGGTSDEYPGDLKVDVYNNVYISGTTNSSTGIASTGAHQTTYGGSTDAFVAKFNNAGTKQWSTYYGGSGSEAYKVALLKYSDGKVAICGSTSSTSGISTALSDEIQTNQGGIDGFIAKFDSYGKREWGTYFGGSGSDYASSLSLSGSTNIFLAGNTSSSSGIASGGHQNTIGGGTSDLFLTKIAPVIPATTPTITPVSISPSTYSCGTSVAFSFTTSGTFNGGNTFTVQVSDATGSFTAPGFPKNIASGSSSPINTTMPYAPPGNYRVRIVSSNPVVTGTYPAYYNVPLASTATGSSMANPVLVGALSCSTNYSNTKNNSTGNCYGNDYDSPDPAQIGGQPSDDIYYKFSLDRSEDVTISTCASGWDTYIHLLDASGNHLASNDDFGPMCFSGNGEASIVKSLPIGDYYVVVEGYGTGTGNITTDIDTRDGLLFDGSNDNVEIDNSSLLNLGTGDFTFEAYVKSNKASGYANMINKRNTSAFDGFVFGIATNGRLWMQLDGANYSAPTTTPNLHDGNCHHLAVTRDSSDSLRFYVDGEKIWTSINGNDISSTGAARMGWDKFFAQYFQGYIRDIRVWNYARTQTQLEANMNQVLSSQTGLIAYWRLLEGSGQTVSDLSGNAIGGTLGTTTSVQTTDPAWNCQAACAGGGPREEVLASTNMITDSLDIKYDLKVYPNPFSDKTNVLISGVEEKVEITIMNMNGSIVYKNEEYVTNEIITLGDSFNSGFYILRIINNKGESKVLKLLKTD